MATLTRPKLTTRRATSPLLTSAVPAPFPRELLQEQSPELASHEPGAQPEAEIAGPSYISEADNVHNSTTHGALVSESITSAT